MGSEITGDQGHSVMKFQYTWGALTTIAVILRFCGQYAARTADLWWDDWLSLVALVSLTPSKRLHPPDYECFRCSHLSGQPVGFHYTGYL